MSEPLKTVALKLKYNIAIDKSLLVDALEYIDSDIVYLTITEAEGTQSLVIIREDMHIAAEIAELKEMAQ